MLRLAGGLFQNPFAFRTLEARVNHVAAAEYNDQLFQS